MADAPTRDAILAELAAVPAEAPVEAAPSEEVVADVETTDEPVEAAADDDVELETGPEDDAPALDDDEPDLTSPDPETQKRLDAVRVAEKRMRAAAERRDAEFATKQREWQERVDRVVELDKLFARAKHDPVSLLKAAGVSEDDFELIAQAVYAESPALQKDPKQKAAAQAKLREREKEDRQTQAEKQIAELREQIEQQKRDAVAAQEAQAYIAQINTAASTKHPLVAHLLKADPNETHDALVKTYNDLGKKLQRTPKAIEVVAAFDKAQRSRLQRLGIDPETIVKAPTAKKPTAVVANTNKPVEKTKPAEPKKLAPTKDEILAELAALPA